MDKYNTLDRKSILLFSHIYEKLLWFVAETTIVILT